MPLYSIEIICRPNPRCYEVERRIKEAIKALERQYKTTYRYDFKKTFDLRLAKRYSANISQMPFVVINGHLEFTCSGSLPNVDVLKLRIKEIIRS